MILYTIVPAEIIFGRNDNGQERQARFETEYLGVKVQIELLPDNRYVINRIISSSPQAFLNPKLQPGTIINVSSDNILKPV